MDWIDSPALSYKLVCNGTDPLTNRFVTARKPHVCELCAGPIAAGERVRAESRRSDDGKHIVTRRVCALCCAAIGRNWYRFEAAGTMFRRGEIDAGEYQRLIRELAS